MIAWTFAWIALAAVAMAAFVGDIRRATLALWVAGLSVGCIYLTVGAEALAIIQWIVCTLVAISFVFFAVMFGEYAPAKETLDRKKLATVGAILALGFAVALVIWVGARPQSGTLVDQLRELPKTGNNLSGLGKAILEGHVLSLEVLALTLFLVLVGGGVLARPERHPENTDTRGSA